MAQKRELTAVTGEECGGRTDAQQQIVIPDQLPVLPLRDTVFYPYIVRPLNVGRYASISAINEAVATKRLIFLTAQFNKNEDKPGAAGIFAIGTVSAVLPVVNLPNGRLRVLVQGVARARIISTISNRPHLHARIERVHDSRCGESPALSELMRSAKQQLERACSLGKSIPSEMLTIAKSLEDPERLAYLIAASLKLSTQDAQAVLESADPIERLKLVHGYHARDLETLSLQREIDSETRDEMDRTQREAYLRHQMQVIRGELGESSDADKQIGEYRERAARLCLPDEARQELDRQMKRLERMHEDSSEAMTTGNYLDWVTSLPWGIQTRDNLDLARAATILDKDHHGLDEVKDRILEHLSVRKLNRRNTGAILCFVGPPGVGKTSLGKSIARALGRKFVRQSLGGVKDEAEIRGHRRTYVGAMPGRIIQGLRTAGSSNPVFLLDEVDKIGAEFRGDPSAALLEVLDPEQNSGFRDHFLGVPFDLSGVMFITTANLLEPIQPAFRDRLEVVRLSGYTEEEKVAICHSHLVPRQIKANGLTPACIGFSNGALATLVREYTYEAGVRGLERTVARVCRKVARQRAQGSARKVQITVANLKRYLGPPTVTQTATALQDEVGTATALAWNESGGDILLVEATTMSGHGELILTGHLGTVMKESARTALSYAKSRAASFDIASGFFEGIDVHVHVPEGATPKDGPSAGVAMAIAMLSAFTGRRVRSNVAMTGEITLRGQVLPIGAVKEKVLAAHRAGIRSIVLPEGNRRNLCEIPGSVRREMTFAFASHISDVVPIALADDALRPPSVPRKRATRKATQVGPVTDTH